MNLFKDILNSTENSGSSFDRFEVQDLEFCSTCGTILPLPTFDDKLMCKLCKKTIDITDWNGKMLKNSYTVNPSLADCENDSSQLINDSNSVGLKSDDFIGTFVDRKCSKCGHEGMTYSCRQTRSADEGQTVFFACPRCNKKNFRQRRTSSSSEEESDNIEVNEEETGAVLKVNKLERIEELKFIQKQRERKHGIDVYSLAIGEQEAANTSTTKEQIENDPWKKKTGGLVDLKVLKERRGNEIASSMASNFAKETNQRDEDAEMQKFIDEQIQLKKQEEKLAQALKEDGRPVDDHIDPGNTEKKFKKPEDALFDLPKYLIESTSKFRSEESLSEQMLSGIPEVDLGVSERIRNIEETEKAKQKLVSSRSGSGTSGKNKLPNSNDSQYAPHNTSVNFVQHKRFDDTLINPDHMVKPRIIRPSTVKPDNQPVVGDAPKHDLLIQASVTQAFNNYHKKSHQNTSRPNPNARRQYHVSTNMNEEMNESMSAVCGNSDVVTNKPVDLPNEKPTVVEAVPKGVEKTETTSEKKKSGKRGAVTEKASDDYCLERFKKNMRHSRSSKIKIA